MMALPSIAPYAMPGEADLPGNRAGWWPDPDRAVLLVHDMQNYFLNAFDTAHSPIPELLANICALRAHAAERGFPVVYSAQPGEQTTVQRGLLRDFWGPGLGAEPSQQAIVDVLAPGSGDTRITKWRYSAFVRTELSDLLESRRRDQLIICGVYAHIGCLMTACDAFMRDIEPFFVADAMADFSASHHLQALTYAADRCAVTMTTRSVVRPVREYA